MPPFLTRSTPEEMLGVGTACPAPCPALRRGATSWSASSATAWWVSCVAAIVQVAAAIRGDFPAHVPPSRLACSGGSGEGSWRLEPALVEELAATRDRIWYVRSSVPLEGTVTVAGAKNTITKLMIAACLADGACKSAPPTPNQNLCPS